MTNPAFYFKMKLFEHQKLGVQFLKECFQRKHGAILAFDMGLGKTITALVYLAILFKFGVIQQALIVVPRSLLLMWSEEIEKWLKIQPFVIQSGKKPRGNPKIVLTTYDMAKKDTTINHLTKDYIVIADEAHEYLSKTKSSRWQAIKKLTPLQIVLLTGTPIYNRIEDLYALMSLVNPEMAGGKAEWADKFVKLQNLWVKRKPYRANGWHCKGKCIKFAGEQIKEGHKFWKCDDCNQNYIRIPTVIGYKTENIPALQMMLKVVMLRKLTHECIDLPEKRVTYVPYQLSTTKAQYNQYLANTQSFSDIHNLIRCLSGSMLDK